jgi:hypothetical protein
MSEIRESKYIEREPETGRMWGFPEVQIALIPQDGGHFVCFEDRLLLETDTDGDAAVIDCSSDPRALGA